LRCVQHCSRGCDCLVRGPIDPIWLLCHPFLLSGACTSSDSRIGAIAHRGNTPVKTRTCTAAVAAMAAAA
jgi:hypothetical protein